jgi:hypothetical protein
MAHVSAFVRKRRLYRAFIQQSNQLGREDDVRPYQPHCGDSELFWTA